MKIFSALALLCCLVPAAVADAAAQIETPRLRADETQTRKPSLPVTIATTLPAHIVAGESLTLNVSVSSSLEQGELVISFVPDDGLVLIAPQQELQFTLSGGNLSGGLFKTNIPLTVVPSQDGRYAVSVDIRHIVNGRVRGVARGITFRVGEEPVVSAKASAANAGTASDSDAESNVISMPAEETIVHETSGRETSARESR